MDYYEVELANSRDYDYTKGDTVMLAVLSDKYPEPEEIEDFLKKSDSRFKSLKVCYICGPLSENETRDYIPFAEELIDLVNSDEMLNLTSLVRA